MNEINYDLHTEEGMANAIAWQQQLINFVKEGGKWAVPRSSAIYTLHHSKKLAEAMNRDEAVDMVFNKMGWEVKEHNNGN